MRVCFRKEIKGKELEPDVYTLPAKIIKLIDKNGKTRKIECIANGYNSEAICAGQVRAISDSLRSRGIPAEPDLPSHIYLSSLLSTASLRIGWGEGEFPYAVNRMYQARVLPSKIDADKLAANFVRIGKVVRRSLMWNMILDQYAEIPKVDVGGIMGGVCLEDAFSLADALNILQYDTLITHEDDINKSAAKRTRLTSQTGAGRKEGTRGFLDDFLDPELPW